MLQYVQPQYNHYHNYPQIRIQFINSSTTMQDMAPKPKPQTRTSIAQKNSKYFTESQLAQHMPATQSYLNAQVNNNRPYSSIGMPVPQPTPDLRLYSHINSTEFPDVVGQRGSKEKKLRDRKETPFMSSKEKYQKGYIKVQEGDTTAQNIEIEPITQHMRTRTKASKAQNQLRELKDYMRTEIKDDRLGITSPIKLRELPEQRSRHRAYYSNHTNINGSKQRQREKQQFSSDTKTYNRQVQYNAVVTRTLEQTIDENIEIKRQNQQLRGMYRDALKAIISLQQILNDRNGTNLESTTRSNASLHSSYDSLQKILKPSLQAELKLWMEKQEKIRDGLKRNAKQAQEEMERAQIRENQYRQINQFLKKENSNLHGQLRQFREGQVVIDKVEDEGNIQASRQSQVAKTSLPLPNQVQSQKQKDIQQQKRIQSVKQLIQKFYQQKILSLACQNEEMMLNLDQRCRNIEKVTENILNQRRVKKNKQMEQKTGTNKMKHNINDFGQNSQILQQSAIHGEVNQKRGNSRKEVGKLRKIYHDKAINTQEVVVPIPQPQPQLQIPVQNVKQQEKVNKKGDQRNQQVVQNLKLRIIFLEEQISRRQKQTTSRIVQQAIKWQRVGQGLLIVKKGLETCNLSNFKHLAEQFSSMLQQRKQLTVRLLQTEQLLETRNTRAWQLQRQLMQTKKKKKQLIDRCIHLQNYIQKYINNGSSVDSFVTEGVFDHHLVQKYEENQEHCICHMHMNMHGGVREIGGQHQPGSCALQWIGYLEKTMVDGLDTINAILREFWYSQGKTMM